MRMRVKMTLVLVFMALFACVTVGTIAYQMVLNDFRDSVQEHAFIQFQKDFAAYVKRYGSLEKAIEAERFDMFVRRSHKRQRPDDAQGENVVPLTDRWVKPPFRHLVFWESGEIILPGETGEAGAMVSPEVRSESVPLEVDGTVVAWAHPEGEIHFAPQDRRYLEAIEKALVTGILIAVGLSLALGLVLGRGLNRRLTRLTVAIRRMQARHDEIYHVDVGSKDELGELAEAFNSMNAELVEVHRELKELSIKDPLTELYNRRHFDMQARQIFDQARRYEQPFSVVIGDLDNFKQINDDFSHETGDAVLREVAEVLKRQTRKSDVVARYGGEEFVILFPNTGQEDALISCEHVRSAIQDHSWEAMHPGLSVTISMGLCADWDMDSVGAMLSCADKRLYKAKATGRNRIVSS